MLKNLAIPIPPNCPSLVALCYKNKKGELIVRDMGCRIDETRIFGNGERSYLVHQTITETSPAPKFIIKNHNLIPPPASHYEKKLENQS